MRHLLAIDVATVRIIRCMVVQILFMKIKVRLIRKAVRISR